MPTKTSHRRAFPTRRQQRPELQLSIANAELAATFVHPDDAARFAVALARMAKLRDNDSDVGRRANVTG